MCIWISDYTIIHRNKEGRERSSHWYKAQTKKTCLFSEFDYLFEFESLEMFLHLECNGKKKKNELSSYF